MGGSDVNDQSDSEVQSSSEDSLTADHWGLGFRV